METTSRIDKSRNEVLALGYTYIAYKASVKKAIRKFWRIVSINTRIFAK